MSQEKMTNQEFFDVAVRGVLRQGQKSQVLEAEQDEGDDPECLYRGPGGLKCAVGHVITDGELGSHGQEGSSAISWIYAVPRLGDVDPFVVRQVQCAHDNEDVGDWPAAYRLMAKRFKLSDAVVTEWEKEVNHD